MAGANRLDQLIEAWTPRLQKAFMDAIAHIRSRAQINVIVTMLEKGDIDGAIRGVGLDPVAFRDFENGISDAFEAGGRFTADAIPPLAEPSGHRLAIMFNARNPRAEDWLRSHSSTLVTGIVSDQRTMIRQHLEAGMAAGDNPKAVALELVGRVNAATGKREGGVVGLTASQEAWSRNYAAELANGDAAALTRNLRDRRFDKTVAKAIREKQPIPADLQAKMLAAYRNRSLRYRAETIARTEALTSLHQAQQEAMRQGIDAGQVKPDTITKVWHSAADSRVRESHRVLNGQRTAFNGVFVSPSGARLSHPGDPSAPAAETVNCRCWMQMKVDFLAGVS